MKFLCATISEFNWAIEKWKLCLFNAFHIRRCFVNLYTNDDAYAFHFGAAWFYCETEKKKLVCLARMRDRDKKEIYNKTNWTDVNRMNTFWNIVINVFLDVALRAERIARLTWTQNQKHNDLPAQLLHK